MVLEVNHLVLLYQHLKAKKLRSNNRYVFEISYCNWKNTFICEINGKKGSLKVSSLAKWGVSKMIFLKRVFPSGKPHKKKYLFKEKDNSWAKEISIFKKNIYQKKKTNLEKDYLISKLISSL